MKNPLLAQNLQEIILTFAEFFKFPNQEFYSEIVSGEVDQQLAELGNQVGYPLNTSFKQHIQGYDELVEEFNACFLGVQKPFAPPIESVYKPWTTDESFQVPFKNQTGYLMGDPAKHIEHILNGLGLEIPPEYHMMPDHLTILLEIFAYFVEKGLWAEAKQFKADHLDWLPDFAERLKQLNRPEHNFYSYVVQQLQHLLDYEF